MHQLSCIKANNNNTHVQLSFPIYSCILLNIIIIIVPGQEFRHGTHAINLLDIKFHSESTHIVCVGGSLLFLLSSGNQKSVCSSTNQIVLKDACSGVVGANLGRLQEGNPTLFTSTPPLNALCASHRRAVKHLVTCTFSIPECRRLSEFFTQDGESFNGGCQLLVSACQTVGGMLVT